MSMSKNQIVMAAIGGVTLVAAAALGYLAFDAYSSKSEATEARDGAAETVKRLLRAEVSPDKESELAYKKNADTLKQATISVAEQNERAIVDIETLEHTNEQLISTIDEVIEIQEAGRERRKNAEKELTRIEEELKTKLLAASGKQIEQQQQ